MLHSLLWYCILCCDASIPLKMLLSLLWYLYPCAWYFPCFDPITHPALLPELSCFYPCFILLSLLSCFYPCCHASIPTVLFLSLLSWLYLYFDASISLVMFLFMLSFFNPCCPASIPAVMTVTLLWCFITLVMLLFMQSSNRKMLELWEHVNVADIFYVYDLPLILLLSQLEYWSLIETLILEMICFP